MRNFPDRQSLPYPAALPCLLLISRTFFSFFVAIVAIFIQCQCRPLDFHQDRTTREWSTTYIAGNQLCRKRGELSNQGSDLGNCCAKEPTPQERESNNQPGKPSHGKLLGLTEINGRFIIWVGLTRRAEIVIFRIFCKPACHLLECRLIPWRRFGTLAASIVIDESNAKKFQSVHCPKHCFLREWVFKFHEAEKRPKNAEHEPTQKNGVITTAEASRK